MAALLLFFFAGLTSCQESDHPSIEQHPLLARVVADLQDSLAQRGLYFDMTMNLYVEPSKYVGAYGYAEGNSIYLDEYMFYYYWYEDPTALKGLVLHELGHWLGLKHNYDDYSKKDWKGYNVMNPGKWINVSNETESGTYNIFLDVYGNESDKEQTDNVAMSTQVNLSGPVICGGNW